MPVVSVVLTTYNHEQFLADAIESALAQTFRNFEIIVVDDGSTDNTRAAAKQFGDSICYIWQENQGVASSCNTGIRNSRGKYVAFLDGDDEWLPTYLETMLNLAARNPDSSVFYCSAQYMDSKGLDLPQLATTQLVPAESMLEILLRSNFLIPSTILARRSALVSAGLFDRDLASCQDWDLWIRIARDYSFSGSPKTLVRYRIHGESLSANSAAVQQSAMAVVRKHYGMDDRKYESWPAEKRRAYGGVYRFHALTSVVRQANWDACADYLRMALRADPSLAKDLELFYELALGTQPVGHRGPSNKLDLDKNAEYLIHVLEHVFRFPSKNGPNTLAHQAYGTAYLALGMVAYGAAQRKASRSFLIQSLGYRSDLWWDIRVISTIIKSLLSGETLDRVRKVRNLAVRTRD